MTRRFAWLAPALLAVSACGPTPPQPAAPAGVAAPELGLRLASLPEGFAVTQRQPDRYLFDAPAGTTRGTASIEVRATAGSPFNLVTEARAYGEGAAAEGGKFFGGNELVTPFGPAYTARVLTDRGLAEERAVFMLHPDGSGRLLVLSLRYPPGDAEGTRARMMQALELVGALELPSSDATTP